MTNARNIASTAEAFENAYRQTSRPPWDVDGPTPFVEELDQSGEIHGTVLDAGCGTGENSLYLAAHQHTVVGLDGSPAAIEKARLKAQERGLVVAFQVTDARDLPGYEACFGTMIDAGLFHVFDTAEDRLRYANALWRAAIPGAMLHLLAFKETPEPQEQPRNGFGTHAVSEQELRTAFAQGWSIGSIEDRSYGGREFLLARIGRI